MPRRFDRSEVAPVVFLLLTTLAGVPVARAQNSVSTGTINGLVEDASGALVANAQIVLTNGDTGYKQTSKTNGEGLFSFSAVPIGTYSLTAAAPGFKGVDVTNVTASIGQTTAVTLKMEVGDVSQQVKVTAEAEVLNTSDANISSVIDNTIVQNLPSLRRNYTDFVLLTPGVTTDDIRGIHRRRVFRLFQLERI
jgi:hypothetical protein